MGNPPQRPVGMCQRHLRVMRPVTWLPIPDDWCYTTQNGITYEAMWLCDDCAAKAAILRNPPPPDAPYTMESLRIDGFQYNAERVTDLRDTVVMMRDVARAGHNMGEDITLSDVVRLLSYLAQSLKDQGR